MQKEQESLLADLKESFRRFPVSATHIGLLMICGLAAGFFEALGISIFLPILQFARVNGDEGQLSLEEGFWAETQEIFAWFGLPLEISTMLGVAIVAILLRQAFLFLAGYFRTWLRQTLSKEISEYFFDRYVRSKMLRQNQYETGDLVNSVMAEATKGSTALLMPLDILVHVMLGLLYVGILALLEWRMTVGAFLVVGLVAILPKIWLRRSRVIGSDLALNSAALSAFLVERFSVGRLIKMSGTEQKELTQLKEITKERKTLSIRKYINITKTQIVIEPTVIVLSLVFIVVASKVFMLPLEAIGVYVLIVLRLVPLLRTTLGMIQIIQDSAGAFHIVIDKLKEMERDEEQGGADTDSEDLRGQIEFRKVSFRYPAQSLCALNSCSVKIEETEFVALVGPSGAGKSTFVDMIPRLLQPTEGEVLLDGRPVDSLSLTQLRSQISFIPQKPLLIPGTVYAHLSYGFSSKMTEAKVQEVMEKSGMNQFIGSLDDGVQTVLSSSRQLSGGQMQRLELARALARGSKIFVLDEPTSNLDAEAEAAFSGMLDEVVKAGDKTVILIAHSLRNVFRAHKIIVLNEGKVTDIGSHNELLATCPWYQNAWRIQQLESQSNSMVREASDVR